MRKKLCLKISWFDILGHNYPLKANKTLQSRDNVPIILLQFTSAVYGISLPDKQFKKCKLPIFAQKIKLRKRHFSLPKDKRVITMRSYNI